MDKHCKPEKKREIRTLTIEEMRFVYAGDGGDGNTGNPPPPPPPPPDPDPGSGGG